MEFRNLGRSGLKVSIVGLGGNNFGRRCDAAQTKAVIDKAIDLGVNLFDTADVYGPGGLSEEYLGQALRGRRSDVLIATKFRGQTGEGPMDAGGSRQHIISAVEASLRRLDTDYIDLYQMHGPDPETPIEETMRALDDLVRLGKVRYIGHSNFAGWQATEAHWVAESGRLTPFTSAQNNYSLLERSVERDLVPACRACNVSILPYFPLAGGLLTGKYHRGEAMPKGARFTNEAPMADRKRRRGPNHDLLVAGEPQFTERNWDLIEKLETFAHARGHSLVELAIGWLASLPHVSSVIAGATTAKQVETNVIAGGEWRLSADELAEVDTMTTES